ncbi:hypothetical protein [Deinococcus sedimenti]|uniref:Uncharacterized protein n=1 Tax=Deinococcus sedimenti TaxID=1867090 RepID=A0ABQ2S9N0_9DEIO|nr:hypothetical protein [Deinococcus sedimenti]GGS11526.1 hypothetical protein GCM10008960_41820 [Deinococcus sedimenti]
MSPHNAVHLDIERSLVRRLLDLTPEELRLAEDLASRTGVTLGYYCGEIIRAHLARQTGPLEWAAQECDTAG